MDGDAGRPAPLTGTVDWVVDWRTLRLRPGEWSCPVHGRIEPARDGLVPYCPGDVNGRTCMRIALQAARRSGKLVHAEPAPKVCDGPERHPLGPNTVLLGWRGCRCTPAGGHRTWTCRACGDVQQWPPPHHGHEAAS